MKTKVITFGTFDLLHLGHLNYFQQAKEHGNHLTVVIARDKNIKKPIIFSEDERLKLVKSLKIVDEAVLGKKEDKLKIIQEINPDIICLGYDHPIKEGNLKESLNKLNLNSEIKRMKPYNINHQKSSKIKKKILTI